MRVARTNTQTWHPQQEVASNDDCLISN